MIDILNRNDIYDGVIVGSRALATYDSSFELSKTTDIDIVMLPEDIPDVYQDKIASDAIISFRDAETSILIEILVAHDNALEIMVQSIFRPDRISIADTKMLYMMKRGHIHRRMIKWERHMHDMMFLKNNFNIVPYVKYGKSNYTVLQLIAKHRHETDMRLGKQRLPNLNVTRDEFFDDGVKKFIEHDYLHEIFAHSDKPMYQKMQKNGEVYCHVDMWNEFTYMDKVHAILEECYVIACERFIIPQLVKGSSDYFTRAAFMWSLMRVCTDLTSGFFRDYAINNYDSIIYHFDPTYFRKVLDIDYHNVS